MKIHVRSRRVILTSAMREHAERNVARILSRRSKHIKEVNVVLNPKDGGRVARCMVALKLMHGPLLHVHGSASSSYDAVENAMRHVRSKIVTHLPRRRSA